MKPYYQDDAVTIYHGDCREILPTMDKVDLVLADPPYGINGAAGNNKKNEKGSYVSDFEDTELNVIENIVPSFKVAMNLAKRSILTPGNLNFIHYPKPQDIGYFWQGAGASWGKWGSVSGQVIFYYGKDPRQGKKGTSSTGRPLREAAPKNGHPCPKPIKAWSWLLNKGSLEGETILDPFMGSGTTLRAAKDLGRKAIGIEIAENYCEIAAKRMSQEVLDFKQF